MKEYPPDGLSIKFCRILQMRNLMKDQYVVGDLVRMGWGNLKKMLQKELLLLVESEDHYRKHTVKSCIITSIVS